MTDSSGVPTRSALDAAAPAPVGAGLRGRPLLLAIDPGPAGVAAAHVAQALAVARGAVPHAVRAFATSPAGMPAPLPSLLAAADALIGPDVHGPDVDAVRADLAAHLGRPIDWPVHVGLGAAAGVIARRAAETRAAMVVMGLRRHGRVDRVLRDETTLNVMRAARCPVLGVTPALTALPRCVVVGTDFGPAATRAARAALDVLADDGRLVLVYVEAAGREAGASDEVEAEDVVYALGVDAAFARVTADIAAPPGVTVARVRVDGQVGRSVADALFATAGDYAADLLAVGSRRHDRLDRLLLGSVTTDLARDGRHSLLVVPPAPASAT